MIDEKHLSQLISETVAAIEYPEGCAGLYRPIEYTLEAGGKRLRPLLTLAVCEALGGDSAKALPQAIGVEMFHNFTLIHDDVMDHSDRRRGRPTVVKRWGETQAILSGDALLTLATQKVAQCDVDKLAEVLNLFNKTALEVYEGQQFDTAFETRKRVKVSEYLEMIRLKTSVLLGCACRMGAIMAGASTDVQEAFYRFGEQLGIAFQLRDDYLDTYGDPEVFGKPIGGDIVNQKHTWLYITAMNERKEAMVKAYERKTNAKYRIETVRRIYNTINLRERCDELISKYCRSAINSLEATGIEAVDREWFEDLTARLAMRTV